MTPGVVAKYVARRLLGVVATVLAASLVVFLAVHALPGNPFLNDPTLRPNQAIAAVHRYGLDRSVFTQYIDWLGNVIQGNLGISFSTPGLHLTGLLLRQASVSAILGGTALILALVTGIAMGVVAGARPNTWMDRVISTLGVLGYSMPSFVVAMLVLEISVVYLYNLTGGGLFAQIGWGKLSQVPLPAACIAWPVAGYVARLVRASVVEVAHEDFVRTGIAKGLKRRTLVWRYLLRNALVPVLSVSGPLVAGVLTGSLVIENLFGIPGLGKEFVDSVTALDYNAVVDVFTLYAVLVGVANLSVDLLLPLVDPRIVI